MLRWTDAYRRNCRRRDEKPVDVLSAKFTKDGARRAYCACQRPNLAVAVVGQASEVVANDRSVVLNVSMTLRQRRRRRRRVVAFNRLGCESTELTRTGTTPLQLVLARDHRRLQMLQAGEVLPLREIAQRDRADQNLRLLAPDIVAAILENALPDDARFSALLINPPVFWQCRRVALGTTPAPPRAKKAGGNRRAGRAARLG